MANNADIGSALRKLMRKRPTEESEKLLRELGLKTGNNNTVVAAALFKKAAKGEISAINKLCELLEADSENNEKLSKLYEALSREE